MHRILCLLLIFLPFFTHAQRILNYVMVSDNGATDKPEDAKYLIVVKKLNNNLYQRLEYHFTGPLMRVISYGSDSMKVMEGDYREYNDSGWISLRGQYRMDAKDGDWLTYGADKRVIRKTSYRLGNVVHDWNEDSLRINDAREDSLRKAHPRDTTHDQEASYKGKDKGWNAYMTKALNKGYPDRAAKLRIGGTVVAQFIIDTAGKVIEAELLHSVEVSLDELVLNALYDSPSWTPAFQGDHRVKAYRRQKLTFQPPQ